MAGRQERCTAGLATLDQNRFGLHHCHVPGETLPQSPAPLQVGDNPRRITDQCVMAGSMLRFLLQCDTVLLPAIVDVVAYEMYTREAGRVYTRS